MDFFDWMPDQFHHEGITADMSGGFLDDGGGVVNWDDYYPDPDSFDDILQRNGSSSSTDDSYLEGIKTNGPAGHVNLDDNSERGKGRPRVAYSSGRDPAMNRIQRRRTQNRNSQRIYRQRRIEERQRFEERALAAEDVTKQLQIQIGEMHAMIAVLRHQLEQVKAENASLRGEKS